jgi:hypothetical protein
MLAGLYRIGLDDNDPPNLCDFTDAKMAGHVKHYPSSLRSKVYPEHMKPKILESNARSCVSGSVSSITTCPSTTTLLAQLWHAPDQQWLQGPGCAQPASHTACMHEHDVVWCVGGGIVRTGLLRCALTRTSPVRLGSDPTI